MSEAYQRLDQGHFDYRLVAVEGLAGQRFRGPPVDHGRPYFACVGAAQTFGRFCERPFPALLAERLRLQVLNLGVGGAGPGWFERPGVLDWLNGSRLVVLQVMAARSESNSLFDNTATGGKHGVRRSDGAKLAFEDFFVDLWEKEDRETIARVVRETRANWVMRVRRLLEAIEAPTILFWFSVRSPDEADDGSSPWRLMGAFPQLVNRAMVQEVSSRADAYVECISTRGLPHPLWPAAERIDGAILRDGVLVNRYYPSREMHLEAADLLEPACRSLLGMGSGRDNV